MKNIISVFRYELVRNINRKAYLFTAFGLPVLIFIAFFAVQTLAADSNEEAQQDLMEEQGFDNGVGYVDLSGLFADVGALRGGEIAPFPNEEAAQDALNDELIDAYYVIAEDFEETRDFTMVIPEFSLSNITSAPVDELIFAVIGQNVEQDIFRRLANPSNVEEIELQRATEATAEAGSTEGEVVDEAQEENDFWLVYVFGLAFMFALFGTNGYLMQSVIEEKETRIVEILIASVRPIQLLAGKIFALGVLGLLQVVAWLATVFILSQLVGQVESAGIFNFLGGITDQVSPVLIFQLVILFIVAYLFFAGAYGAVGAISTSLQNGPNYALIFTMPLIVPFFVLQTFVETPDAGLPVFLSLFPLTSPLAMVMRLSATDVPFAEFALAIGLLLLADIFMIWLAGRLFRAQSLLAGQVPKPREIPKLLFGS